MKNKFIFIILIIALILASVPSCHTGTTNISGWFSPQAGQVVMSNPNPSDTESDVSINQATWNITIKDQEGDTFNWSIEVSNGDSNSSNDDTNGSKLVDLTTPLTYSTTFTVWVNATDAGSLNAVNNSYTFTTEDEFIFSVYSTLTFGGKCDVQSDAPSITDQYPANESTDIDMYPLLNVTIDEPQNENFNITWKSNSTGIWTVLQYNDTCTDGTYTHRAVFANASNTKYWWRVEVNDSAGHWTNETYEFTTASYSWSNWSDWWEFNYTIDYPASLTATPWNQTAINLSWTINGGIDTAVLIVNESGWTNYPNAVTNGTELYNGTNLTFNHTGLVKATTYYYSIWGYNKTDNNYSLGYDSAQGTTQGDISILNEYPANKSTGVERPPTNFSISVTGTNLDINFSFLNMNGTSDVYESFKTWTGESAGRIEFTPPGLDDTRFVWGNTTYHWYVNITDGSTWLNKSFWFNTSGSRYDVDNNDNVFVGDLSSTWANRAVYNRYYDTDGNGNIFVGDLSTIWANR